MKTRTAKPSPSQGNGVSPPPPLETRTWQKPKPRSTRDRGPKFLADAYGLSENPFGVTPDPRYLYESETHLEAKSSLIVGIECAVGFQALIAPPGMGKTTLLCNILEEFDDVARTAFLFQTQGNSRDFLRYLISELGGEAPDSDIVNLQETINQLLIRERQAGRQTIVIIDEAQNLPPAVLETLRLLSNFETSTEKLLHIILAGQPQLAQKLASPEAAQLSQRICILTTLHAFTLEDTSKYIEHRLKVAGYQGPPMFSPEAVAGIWERSGGVPREINKVCFNSLLLARAEKKKGVDSNILQEVTSDLDLQPIEARTPRRRKQKGKSEAVRQSQPMAEAAPSTPALEDRQTYEPLRPNHMLRSEATGESQPVRPVDPVDQDAPHDLESQYLLSRAAQRSNSATKLSAAGDALSVNEPAPADLDFQQILANGTLHLSHTLRSPVVTESQPLNLPAKSGSADPAQTRGPVRLNQMLSSQPAIESQAVKEIVEGMASRIDTLCDGAPGPTSTAQNKAGANRREFSGRFGASLAEIDSMPDDDNAGDDPLFGRARGGASPSNQDAMLVAAESRGDSERAPRRDTQANAGTNWAPQFPAEAADDSTEEVAGESFKARAEADTAVWHARPKANPDSFDETGFDADTGLEDEAPALAEPHDWDEVPWSALWLRSQWRTHRDTIYVGIAGLVLLLALLWIPHSSSQNSNNNYDSDKVEASPVVSAMPSLASPQATAFPPPHYHSKARVWLDVHTQTYYCSGAPSYGATPGGKFTTQQNAHRKNFEPANHQYCR